MPKALRATGPAILTVILTAMGMVIDMTTATAQSDLLRLMSWLSPGFPVGAYAYSHGLEYAVESGRVRTRQDLETWLEAVLRFGSANGDAAFFCRAWQALTDGDHHHLSKVIDEAHAFPGTKELSLESLAQGAAFCQAIDKGWPALKLGSLLADLDRPASILSYPVAVALAAATAEIPMEKAFTAYLHGFCANAISAAVRLVPLGQTDGLIALAHSEALIDQVCRKMTAEKNPNPANSAIMVDWFSTQHEIQYARLFRS